MSEKPSDELVEQLRAAGDPVSLDAAATIENLTALVDPDLTFRELEAKIRDGSFHIHVVGGEEGGSPTLRLLAAVLLNILLGPDCEEPPNYRMVEWRIKPAGEVESWRLIGEVVKPDGSSSHEIRQRLESELSALRAAGGFSTKEETQ